MIRPFAVGRKNWLLCKSTDGATTAANAYNLVETTKINGLDVLRYVNFVFQSIPMADGNLSDDFLESLILWCVAICSEWKRSCTGCLPLKECIPQ